MAKKVLIVEDDEAIARNLADVLESEGYCVESAENGKAALEKLHADKGRPALILLDLMMPVMDGFAFRSAQESDPGLASIPVVIMTADGHIEAKRHRVRAKAFLKKPLDIDDILDVVERHCA